MPQSARPAPAGGGGGSNAAAESLPRMLTEGATHAWAPACWQLHTLLSACMAACWGPDPSRTCTPQRGRRAGGQGSDTAPALAHSHAQARPAKRLHPSHPSPPCLLALAHRLHLILAQPSPHAIQRRLEGIFELHPPGELKDGGACTACAHTSNCRLAAAWSARLPGAGALRAWAPSQPAPVARHDEKPFRAAANTSSWRRAAHQVHRRAASSRAGGASRAGAGTHPGPQAGPCTCAPSA